MYSIDERLTDLEEEMNPLNNGGEPDEEELNDLIGAIKDEAVSRPFTFTCSTCGAQLKGSPDDFLKAGWMMAILSGSEEGWTGYIRLTACAKCRDDPGATDRRMNLINILDDWSGGAHKTLETGGETRD